MRLMRLTAKHTIPSKSFVRHWGGTIIWQEQQLRLYTMISNRYVAFLCARLLEVSCEERAAHTVQRHWRLSRTRRAGTRRNELLAMRCGQ